MTVVIDALLYSREGQHRAVPIKIVGLSRGTGLQCLL
jgi:hypothetical protein